MNSDSNTAIRCECYKRERQERRLRFATIPKAFEDVTLRTFKKSVYKLPESLNTIEIAMKAIKYYLDNFKALQEQGKGLYISSGTKGSGKTRLAISIANKLLEEHQVKFATSSTIIEEIKKTYHEKSEYTESKLIDDLINTEILIIDDFGAEKYTEWKDDRFYLIINERYINKKVTIYTSNYALDNLVYDERIINRIKEQAFQLQFPEESVREHIAEQNANELIINTAQF